VPSLASLDTTSASIGQPVSIHLAGADMLTAKNNVIRFTQGGLNFDTPASQITANGLDASGLPSAIISTSLPSGLSPSSTTAVLGVPATVSVLVDGVEATGAPSLLVQPPSHALELVPASAAPGTSVQITGVGVFSHFGAGSIVSADTGLNVVNAQFPSATQFVGTVQVASTATTGAHQVTVSTGSESISFPFTVVLNSPQAPTLSKLSISSGTPLTPLIIQGSGFSGVGQVATSVLILYSYNSNVVSIPARADSDTEISTFVPPLVDTISGAFYVGPVTIQISVNGEPTSALSFALLALPANSSPVGTSTLAYLNSSQQTLSYSIAETQANPAFSPAEISSIVSVENAALAKLTDFQAGVATASAQGTATLSDGTVITKAGIDALDRFIQQSGILQQSQPPNPLNIVGLGRSYVARPRQSSFVFSDTTEANIQTFCSVSDVTGKASTVFSAVSAISCLGSAFPPLAAVCGATEAYSGYVAIFTDVTNFACDLFPVNLESVSITPSPIKESVNVGQTTGAAIGQFGINPKLVLDAPVTILDVISSGEGDALTKELETYAPILQSAGKYVATGVIDAIVTGIENVLGAGTNVSLQSPLTYSKSVPLTTATTSFLPSSSGFPTTNGLIVGASAIAGQADLQLDLSKFRLVSSSGDVISNSGSVTGNSLPVTILTTVTVVPNSPMVPAGGQQQFTATVNGSSNQGVTWSVDNVSSGNATVGTISAAGLYTAPSVLGNHVITATSQFDGQAGTAQVQMTVGVTVSPVAVQLQITNQQVFTATVLGTSSTAVTWSIQEGASGGTLTTLTASTVQYKAPTTEGIYHLVVTLVSDPTKSALATITVSKKPIWPMSGHDAQRDGQALYSGPSVSQIAQGPRWTFNTAAPLVGDITVSSEGTIYFASDKLYALNPDGTQFAAPVVLSSAATGPVIDDVNGFVYVAVANANGTFDITRYSKTLTNPSSVIHVAPAFGGLISPLILGTDGTLYFTSGRFPAVVYSVGSHSWSNPACPGEGGPVPASAVNAPALGTDGSIFVMCSGNYIQNPIPTGLNKIDPVTGSQLAFSSYSIDATEPVIDKLQHIHAGYQAFSGASYCGGFDEWDSSLNNITVPSNTQCAAYTTGRASILLDGNSTVRIGYSYQTEHDLTSSGAVSWNIVGDGNPRPPFTSIPTVDAGGTIIVGTGSGVVGLSQSTGATIWQFSNGDAITTQPVIPASGILYVGSKSGTVYAF
jgi:hypothetical protein